jgi:hypothetical protein
VTIGSGCASSTPPVEDRANAETADASPRRIVLTPEDLRRAAESTARVDANCCRGRNACKGKGNCAVDGEHACRGQNECKARGGCKADDCAD